MGLNDNIYTISKSIVSEKQEKQKQREQKEVLAEQKTEVKQLLLLELISAKKENINIYKDEVKEYIIHSVLSNYISGLNSEFKKRFETNYKKEVQQHILLYYYNVCSQAERIAKKQQEDTNDYKQQIALEKWELQRQKLQLQIEKEKQKQVEKQQAEAEQKKNNKVKILLAIGCLICAPIFIFALLIIGIINAAANSK